MKLPFKILRRKEWEREQAELKDLRMRVKSALLIVDWMKQLAEARERENLNVN